MDALAVMEAFNPVHDIQFGLGARLVADLMDAFHFQVLKKLSIAALSQQLALRLIDWIT
jgi:hypothetical protein